MRKISCFHSPSKAQHAVDLLEEKGIGASLSSEKFHGDHEISLLAVDEGAMEDAMALISTEDSIHAIRCPECRSIYITYPSTPANSPMAAMTEKVAESLGVKHRAFFCHACQYEWDDAAENATQRSSA